MPNVLDAEPMRAFARRVGGKIGDEKAAARFERLAFERLLADARNFRAARPEELAAAPDWARQAQARGEDLHVFALHRGASARLHTVARRLADTCRVAEVESAAQRPGERAIVIGARKFLDTLHRASFDVIARKALYFSRVHAAWNDDGDREPVCEEQEVAATRGRIWRRVRSVGELRAIGHEFRNCLARTSRTGSYGAMLVQGAAQFWVLRDARGAGLMVAMAPAPQARYFSEVRGPRNARIFGDHVDLMRLGLAIGMLPEEPPPPPDPPAPRTAPAAFGETPLGLAQMLETLDILRS